MKDAAHAADADNADAPDTAIASLSPPAPARDPVEDADASFTRKRPRLDSGSNSLRALSHDTASEDLLPESTTPTSSRDRDRDRDRRQNRDDDPKHAKTRSRSRSRSRMSW